VLIVLKASFKIFVHVILISGLILLNCRTDAQFGFKAGISISNLSYTDEGPDPNLDLEIDLRPYLGYDIYWIQLGEQGPLLSPYISIFYDFEINRRVSLLPEISFLQKGVDFSTSEYERVIYKVKISYLEMPVSIDYAFILKEAFHSSLYFGGYAALKLNAVKKTAINNKNVSTTQLTQVKSFDGGIQFGLNFKYNLKDNYLLLDIRFSRGLSDVFTSPDDQVNLYHEIQNSRNNTSIISLGYGF